MSLASLVVRLQQRGQGVTVVAVAANGPEPATPDVAPESAESPDAGNHVDWRELDEAYLAHHFNCPSCIAAGRGVCYGPRCGPGAELWTAYLDAGTSLSAARKRLPTSLESLKFFTRPLSRKVGTACQ
jgi:hypothetical protein